MAIVSISRIQHRRGLNDDLPQLSSGELGWAINTRKLFIGNGTATEGAPAPGNTEILTEFSDIMDLLDTYTYQGDAAGYMVSTGVDSNSPVHRTLQEKFDDIVSVKDFGALGNNYDDDTAAINRALYELFSRNINTEIRRALYFPAGTYKVSAAIKIPSYASIIGEGMDCTFILQTVATEQAFTLADSKQQVAAQQGNNGATTSRYIDVSDITFSNTANDAIGATETDITNIYRAFQCRFVRVRFAGARNQDSEINTVGNNYSCIKFSTTCDVTNLVFDQCEFAYASFMATVDGTINGLRFNKCYSNQLYFGLSIGQSGGTNIKGVTVTETLFDNVYSSAIKTYSGVSGVVSAFNSYLDVANSLLGEATATPGAPVLEYVSIGNTSVNDYFTRTSTAELVWPKISGYTAELPTRSKTLADNVAATTTGIDVNIAEATVAMVDYQITRSTNVAVGTVRIAHNATAQAVDDLNRLTNTGSVGVTFSITFAAGVTTLKYATTSTGSAATMKYQIRYIR